MMVKNSPISSSIFKKILGLKKYKSKFTVCYKTDNFINKFIQFIIFMFD